MGDTSTDRACNIESITARVQELEAELARARAALTVENSRVLAECCQASVGESVGSGSVSGFHPVYTHQAVEDETAGEAQPGIMLQPLQRYDAVWRKWKLGSGLPAPKDCNCPCSADGRRSTERGRLRLFGLLADGTPWEHWVSFGEMARPGGITLGRDPELCNVVLEDDSVSRAHARLELTAMGVVISDIHSTNGLMVNDTEVSSYSSQVPVVHGSVVRIGETPLRAEFYIK